MGVWCSGWRCGWLRVGWPSGVVGLVGWALWWMDLSLLLAYVPWSSAAGWYVFHSQPQVLHLLGLVSLGGVVMTTVSVPLHLGHLLALHLFLRFMGGVHPTCLRRACGADVLIDERRDRW